MQPELNWQKASTMNESVVSKNLCDWVLHPGSFMQRLEQHGAVQPRVQVLGEAWQRPTEDEKNCLNLSSNDETLIREVLILSEGKHWMYARTVFTREIIAVEPQLAELKTRSLGSILFKDPTMRRSEFEVVNLHSNTACFQTITRYAPLKVDQLWARRSKFYLQDKPLLLTEFFLPDIETL